MKSKQSRLMYESPAVRVVVAEVEKGFAATHGLTEDPKVDNGVWQN